MLSSSYHFWDAAKSHTEVEMIYSFPTVQELTALRIGDKVKVRVVDRKGSKNGRGLPGETFFTKIVKWEKQTIVGQVIGDRNLTYREYHGILIGEEVKFEYRNIFQIVPQARD